MIHKPYNLPFRSTTAEYESVLAQVVEAAKGNDTVKAVYRTGGKWTPGVSDIDIVVVYKKGIRPVHIPGPWGLSLEAERIFTHRYFAFDEEDFASFFYLHPSVTTVLVLAWGEDCMPEDSRDRSTDAEYQLFIAANLIDVFVNKLLLFPLHVGKKKMNVRKMLLELYSLKYTSRLLQELDRPSVGDTVVAEVSALRKNWFTMPESESIQELVRLSDRGVVIVGEAMLETDTFLREQGFVISTHTRFKNKQYSIEFTDQWKTNEWADLVRRTFVSIPLPGNRRPLSHMHLTLPSSFAPFFHAHDAHDGILSSLVSGAMRDHVDGNLSPDLGHLVHERIGAINRMFGRTMESGGLYRVPFTYGFSMIDVQKPSIVRVIGNILYMLALARRVFPQ